MENGIVVKVVLKENKNEIEYELKELCNLAKTSFIEITHTITQLVDVISAKTYIKSGKLLEVKSYIDENDIDIVIFDDELSATQLRNIEEVLDIKVIDRSMLILDIFAKRAKSNESILEVKLAQLKYLYPRLSAMNKDLSRQGGFQAKGPGEKQIDLDKRKIANEIYNIECKLKDIKRNRLVQKQKRISSDIPIIALAGYTNSGKSTTMNTLIKQNKVNESKLVYQKDELFATLGTHVRKIKLNNKLEFMLIDTVGFISKLPHHLVNSFHSTLSDIIDADLIIHVVDSSDINFNKHIKVTNEVLDYIDASSIKQLYLLNKCDKKCNAIFLQNEDKIYYSNNTLENYDKLIEYITSHCIKNFYQTHTLRIPLSEGKLISYLEAYAITRYKFYTNEYIEYKCAILSNKIKDFIDFVVQ